MYFLFIGYSEKYDNLVESEPSFGRIFHYEELNVLNDEEVRTFFINTFNKVNFEWDEESLDLLVFYSQGLPLVMQNIGDFVYWLSEDNCVSKEIVIESISETAREFGSKQLRFITKEIKNNLYI